MIPSLEDSCSEPTPDLADCLERVRRHDQAAACELIKHLHPIVLRTVRGHLPRLYAVEDIMQDVYLKVFTRLEQYRNIVPITHWVSKIALRTCLNHLRTQRSRPELRYADLSSAQVDMIEATHADPSQRRKSEAFANRELLNLLLARLNAADRQVIVLFHLEQKSIAEISQLTGWDPELAKMRVFRARRKLQRALAKLSRWDRAGFRSATRQRARSRRSFGLAAVSDVTLVPQAA